MTGIFQNPMVTSRQRIACNSQLAGCSSDRSHEGASSRCASYPPADAMAAADSPAKAATSCSNGSASQHGSAGDVETGLAQQQRLRHSHPYKSLGHQPRRASADHSASGWCSPRLPRTTALCRMLVAFVAALAVFHALSCGLFFCVRIPSPLDGVLVGGYAFVDPVRFRGPKVITADATSSDALPSLIPRIVHQFYRQDKVPPALAHLTDTWALLNEGWELRRYSETSASEFVLREFPEYVEAYRLLPSSQDKADLFKFLVVLRIGGVYADVWSECKKPLDDVVLPKDTLLVGWEAVLPSASVGFSSSQISERVFGGAPGHPALREVVDTIAAASLHRTGAGLNRTRLASDSAAASGDAGPDEGEEDQHSRSSTWTDIVLNQAVKHPLSENDPWSVRVLPGVAFGLHEGDLRHVYPFESQVVAIGHEQDGRGGSQRDAGLSLTFLAERVKLWLWPSSARHPVAMLDQRPRQAPMLRPVSAAWDPPFTILSYAEDGTAAGATSDMLTNYGLWQPSLAPNRHPSVVEAIIGPLALRYLKGRVFLDVGAGSGFFTLAAAARGHRAVALELSDPLHTTLVASLRYNNFDKNVTLIKAAAGDAAEVVCVSNRAALGDEDVERGYSRPQVHAATGEGCLRLSRRETVESMVPANTSVGAVRVSANGWEARVLAGMTGLLREQRPWVLLIEAFPLAMAEVEAAAWAAASSPTAGSGTGGGAAASAGAGPVTLAGMMQQLYDLGYHDVSHSGYICDERWANITASLRDKGGIGAAADGLQQPTWCRISPDLFPLLAENAKPGVPENLLFAYKQERQPAAQQQQQAGSAAVEQQQEAVEQQRGDGGGLLSGPAPAPGDDVGPEPEALQTSAPRFQEEAAVLQQQQQEEEEFGPATSE